MMQKIKQRFVKVALCQRCSSGDKEENIRGSVAMIEEALACRPDLDVIVFPEYNCNKPASLDETVATAEDEDGPYVSAMREQAKKHGVNILPGTFLEKHDGKKTRNTCVFLNRDGQIIARYSKVHLMDAIGVKESNFTEPGDKMCVFDADFARVGIMVCFDLRFPEMPRSMVLAGAEVILCPALFPSGAVLPLRSDHWDILTAGTALYNLTWVCAVNQFGQVNSDLPFGRSRVIDPWGTVTASASGRQEVVHATLDMEYMMEIRSRVATLDARRPDVYKL